MFSAISPIIGIASLSLSKNFPKPSLAATFNISITNRPTTSASLVKFVARSRRKVFKPEF